MRADYQLKHQLYGQQGSLWEKQVDATTRRRIRRIVKEAGNAPTLTATDRIAASAINACSVLVEDVFFRFSSGNFAVIGQLQREYLFRASEAANGKRLHVAYRSTSPTVSVDATPTQLARISTDFLRSVSSANLSEDRDWYLVPVPRGMLPMVIEGREPDTYLVNGVDFTAHDGYIAMTDDPEIVLPVGLVRVSSAEVRVASPSSSAVAADKAGGRYLAEYAHKTQSLSAFKRAAAEYVGLYVTQTADVVLGVHSLPGGVTVYNLAAGGAVEITYPHTVLLKHQQLPPGFIISGRFDVVASRYNEAVNLKQITAASWGGDLMLDGILPVNGLTWDGRSRIPIDYISTGLGGKPHLRLHFGGPQQRLTRYWEFQRLHELKTGVYLFDALGDPDTPSTIDFWPLLETFYGTQLCLILMDHHSPRINTRMWRFVTEHRPQSCVALVGLDMDADLSLLTLNSAGVPLLDEIGEGYYDNDPLDGYDNYFRPDGIGLYLRQSGIGYYLRP